MFVDTRCEGTVFWLFLWAALVPALAVATPAAAGGLVAGVPPLHPTATADGRPPVVLQACTDLAGDTEHKCFDALGAVWLNVGAFFDATRPSSEDHYFLKLFTNDSGDTLKLTGMGFYARTTDPELNVLRAAGAILMDSLLVFPRTALPFLAANSIAIAPETEMTCVAFDAAIDITGKSVEPVLLPGQRAWMALRFPDLPKGVELEIRVDDDDHDQDCDFMTPDAGEYWYRPDGHSRPSYDWGISVFYEANPSRPQPPPPTWTLVKSLYR